jgi:hypothetical protein
VAGEHRKLTSRTSSKHYEHNSHLEYLSLSLESNEALEMKRARYLRLAARAVAGLILLGWLGNTSNLLRRAISIDTTSVSTAVLQEPFMVAANGTDAATNNVSISLSWKDTMRIDSKGAALSPPRFLLGIMSHELPETGPREPDRRAMLRETYLRYYLDHHGTPDELRRICGLHEIVSNQVSVDDCQIAYTFVMGQVDNPPTNNRTEFLNAPTTSQMIKEHKEADVLSLDILENGKYGKSPTWFRYATLLMKERNLPFDYVIKTDSDTLLIPARFLRWIDKQERKIDYQRTHIYGGMPLDRVACGYPSHDHCHNMSAPYFHGGGFYFASIDVSEYIVSDRCPRSTLFIPHEDVTMGNCKECSFKALPCFQVCLVLCLTSDAPLLDSLLYRRP